MLEIDVIAVGHDLCFEVKTALTVSEFFLGRAFFRYKTIMHHV